MAKANVTRKWIKDNFMCCSAGYCDLQNLLHFQSADYYTCGVYGWNFDVYTFGDYAVTTGYRNMIDNVSKDYHSLIREYDTKAREILKTYGFKDYEKQKKEVNSLLAEFLGKVFDTDMSRYIY